MIRPARVEDAPRLAELNVAAWWAAYGGYIEHEKIAAAAERVPAAWHDLLSRAPEPDDGECWVLERDGELLGWIGIGQPRDRDARPGDGELRAIYVDPEEIGRGHGHQLLGHAEERLVALGHPGATLWVFVANGPARAFYERHGWAPDDRPGEDPWDWAPCLRYRKVLDAPAGAGPGAGA